MPGDISFFDKPFQEQVKIAIDCSDPKLLQVLLGLENCQLWEYWLTHSLLLHNIFGIVKTLKYQLPMNIITAQSQVLAKSFPSAYRALPTIKEFYLPDESIATLEQLERELENTTKTYKILAKIFPTIYSVLPTKDEDQLSEELADILKQLETKPENTITCLSKIIEINEIQQHRELVNILEYFKIAFEVVRRNIIRHKANNDKVNEVNQELESAEQEILEKYKSFNYESVDNKYQISSVQNMYYPDSVGKYDYSYYSDDYTEVNNCVREVAEEFKNNLVVQPVLKLDLSNHYNEIYEEVYNEIIKDYKLRIEEDQLIYPLYEGNESLAKKSSKLREGDNKLQSILSCISREVVSKIKNEEFITEVYDRLVDHVLDISSKDKNHPLHKECCNLGQDTVKKKIKEQVKENSDYRLLNGFMEYAVNRSNPSIHIISILVANGASLLSSHINDPKTKKLITVKEYLLKLRGEYEALVNRSIFTIMRKVHKLVFDFPVIGEEGVDLLKVVSTVPSEEGCFEDSGKNVPLLNKIGGEGEREFISLLKDCIENVYSQEKYYLTGTRFSDVLVPFFRDRSTEKDFEEAYAKLYDCIDIGYLAVTTGDDNVITDYIREIEEEAKQSRSPNLKKLYEKFLTILKEYNDLPKSIFLTKWWKYICRTVKSYTTEWSPAWEKILKGPGYPTDVTEWSQNKYKNIEKAEKEKKDARIAEAEARADEEKTRADRLEIDRRVRRAFTRKIRRLDNALGDIVEDNQDEIVEAVVNCVMEHGSAPEPIVSTVMEEIKLNREQVIRESVVNVGLINAGIRSFLTDVNVEPGCSYGMGRS